MAKGKQKALFKELDEIVSILRSGQTQDTVILIIPSHDRREEELPNQDMWAGAALELFADLYRGATAFKTFKGVWRCDDGKILYDNPILIESFVSRADLENEQKLTALLAFAKRMGKETNQDAVAIVINNVFHAISDYRLP